MRKYPCLFIAFTFFIYAVLTLPDYGINWDSSFHFKRGQAYLNFFLTGKKDYTLLNPSLKRSVYQDDRYDYHWVAIQDARVQSHPPMSDVLEASFNRIFYGFFRIMDDIDSYHLFIVFMSSITILIVGVWVTDTLSSFAGFIASLSLALYPLFLGESHFNFKDPPETAFYALTLFTFWKGIVKRNSRYLIISAFFFVLALGTKFNIIFAPLTMLFWLIFYALHKRNHFAIKPYAIAFLLCPLVIIAVWLSFWPYLWLDPVQNTIRVIRYYIGIGTGIRYQDNQFYIYGLNVYPLEYFLFTTPIPTLILVFSGFMISVYFLFKKSNATFLLWILLFIAPLARISLSQFSSYGGLRQILEFSVGMAVLVGVCGYVLERLWLKKGIPILSLYTLTVFVYSFTMINLFQLHPNENLYFNMLVGGHKGAMQRHFPGWGESFGNAYFQGMQWINKHAEPNAKIAITMVGEDNLVPYSKMRKDIAIDGAYWSGMERQGEYFVETHVASVLKQHFGPSFLYTSLNPVYVVISDGVPIAYVFKNDKKYVKSTYQGEEKELSAKITSFADNYIVTFPTQSILSRIKILYKSDCKSKPNGSIALRDGDDQWHPLSEALGEQYYTLPQFEMGGGEGELVYFIALKQTKSIKIHIEPQKDCQRQVTNLQFYGLD